MKRTLALLFSALMLAGALSGCGTTDKDDNSTANGSGSLANDVQGTTTDSNYADNNISSTPNESTVDDDRTDVPQTGTTSGTTSANTTTQRAVIRGTTYGQMLRNARVHDADGDLTDGENAVTPGSAYYRAATVY